MEFRQRTLANGLEVVAECQPRAVSCAVGFFVNAGSRDETPDVSGVSHFLEHMMFKGTPTRSPEDVNREFDEMGASYNAMTSEEQTIYYASLLPEYLPRAMELWADVLRPALRAEDFTTEKQVILEEIEMYEDRPPYMADDICKEFHFQSHPLANSVLGSPESVSALQVEQMRDYFERQYSPGNIILAAAGKIDFDELCGLAEKYCGHWKPQATHRPQIEPARRSGLKSIAKPNSQQQYFIELANAPTCRDPLRLAASVLTMIVGDDTGSRLFWDLVDCGRAEHVVVSYSDYTDAGLFSTYMSCDPEVFEENLKTIRDVFREVEVNGVTEAELEQAKNKAASSIVLSGERPRSRLFKIGGSWAKRREYKSVKDVLDMVRAITLDDIRQVLDRYPLSAGSAVAVGPAEIAV